MNYAEESLKLHRQWRGKLSVTPKMEIKSREDLSLAYTPGVAQPCLEIKADPKQSFELTGRWNTVAVVTDAQVRSAVWGAKSGLTDEVENELWEDVQEYARYRLQHYRRR